MAAGAGDIWWSEQLGENLHQIHKLEKAIKREEGILQQNEKKMNEMVAKAMQEMEDHEAKFRRARSLRQPMHDGPLGFPVEETAASALVRQGISPVDIGASSPLSIDSATASAASTTRAQNSSRQSSSRFTTNAPANPSEEQQSSTANRTGTQSHSYTVPVDDRMNNDPLLSFSLAIPARFHVENQKDDPLLSASLLPVSRA